MSKELDDTIEAAFEKWLKEADAGRRCRHLAGKETLRLTFRAGYKLGRMGKTPEVQPEEHRNEDSTSGD